MARGALLFLLPRFGLSLRIHFLPRVLVLNLLLAPGAPRLPPRRAASLSITCWLSLDSRSAPDMPPP